MTEERLLLKFLRDFVEKVDADESPEALRDEILDGEKNLSHIAREHGGD